MKKIYLILFGIAIVNSAFCQSTSPEIVSTTGDDFSNGTNQLSWTIGEISIETYSNVSNQLTQGFHQTNLSVVGIEEADINYSVSIFPNPTSENITINTTNKETLYYELFDLNGKLLQQNSVTLNVSIDMSHLTKGTYILKIKNSKNEFIHSSKIIKQ